MQDKANNCSACLTFDFDSFSVWLHGFSVNSPTHMSKGEFGGRVGVPRILDLLRDYGITATFFVPGHTIDSWPGLVERIAGEGHEIGHHGYRHSTPVTLTRDEEKRELERGLEAILRVAGVEPAGYRSPAWDLSPNSLDLFREFGLQYDSSLMATDFEPYFCREGDVPHDDKGFEWGTETDLVEVPVSWSLDDFPYFEFLFQPMYLHGLAAPSRVLEMWAEDFDYMYGHVPGGVFNATFHPQVIGRGARMNMLEGLINHIRGHAGTEFKTVRQVVAEFKAQNRPNESRAQPWGRAAE